MTATPDPTSQGPDPQGIPRPPDEDIRDLLADAKLVADYGVRSGRLGKEATLFDAIRTAAAQESALGWKSPETVLLQKELGQAISLIYPVTLPDLRAGWRGDVTYMPGFWRRTADVLKKGVVVCATAYLIYLCASLTVWQQRAAGLVNQFSSDKIGQQDKTVDELLVLIGDDRIEDLSNPASPLRETFRQKLREIGSIQRSMQADLMTLRALNKYQSANAPLIDWLGNVADGAADPLSQEPSDKEKTILALNANSPDAKAPPVTASVVTPAVAANPSGDLARAASRQPGATPLALDCNEVNAQGAPLR
jgi:hypothetical protein